MRQKLLNRLVVGMGGASLCLLLLGTNAFAQSATQVAPFVITGTVATDPDSTATVVTDIVATGTVQGEPGLLVGAVEQEGPAAKAGLTRGDIILKVNDKAVNNIADVQALLASAKIGEELVVTVQHGDATRHLKVTLGERKGRPFLGIVPVAAELTKPNVVIRKLDRPLPLAAAGAMADVTPTLHVLGVIKDSPADKAGLQSGDVIVAFNGEPLSPERDWLGQLKGLKPGDAITVKLEHKDGEAVDRKIILGENPGNSQRAFLGIQVMPNVLTAVSRKLINPMAGGQFMYAVPAPYLGWPLPLPYYVMPPLLNYQYNFQPGPERNEAMGGILLSIPDVTGEQQSGYNTAPLMLRYSNGFAQPPSELGETTVYSLNSGSAASTVPQSFTVPFAQPAQPFAEPAQLEAPEDVTL